MERDKINLDGEQWHNLAQEHYLEIDGKEVPIKIVQENYNGSGRHTEYHDLVFQILETGKFYKLEYEVSVKDSMGWDECNDGDTFASEVFPETVETIIYK